MAPTIFARPPIAAGSDRITSHSPLRLTNGPCRPHRESREWHRDDRLLISDISAGTRAVNHHFVNHSGDTKFAGSAIDATAAQSSGETHLNERFYLENIALREDDQASMFEEIVGPSKP